MTPIVDDKNKNFSSPFIKISAMQWRNHFKNNPFMQEVIDELEKFILKNGSSSSSEKDVEKFNEEFNKTVQPIFDKYNIVHDEDFNNWFSDELDKCYKQYNSSLSNNQ